MADERVVVVGYDPGWPAAFAGLRDRVAAAVGDLAVAIEHVGSTAVPGLAAKPVIDMDVVVRAQEDVAECTARVREIGYVHRGDLGIAGREAYRAPTGHLRHNLYVCVQGGLALRNHLAIRDCLRAHPADARAYGALKRRLAAQHPDDVDAYCRAKTGFLIGLLRRCGLSEEELERVRGANAR